MDPKRRLRVLVVTNMYPTPETPAFGSFVRDQVRALQATGAVDVDLFAFDARGRPWQYVRAAAALRRRRRPHDLVHAHYGLSGVVCLALPRRLPLVLTVHGRDCHHPVVRRLTALAARRAAATVAVSRELAAICPFPVTAVVPPGVDIELFKPCAARRRPPPARARPGRALPALSRRPLAAREALRARRGRRRHRAGEAARS